MSLPHMILGLLDMQPMSGYDLNKAFLSSVQHFWSADQSQIYRALHKLLEQEWVEVERVTQVDNPDKKVYRPTEAGLDELRRWSSTPISEGPTRQAWLGQIFFSEGLPNADIMALLQQYRSEVAARLQSLEALYAMIEASGSNPDRGAVLRLLTLDYGLQVHRFEISWLDHALARIAGLTDKNA